MNDDIDSGMYDHFSNGADVAHRRADRVREDFLHGFSMLDDLGPAVFIGGSALVDPNSPEYRSAVLLSTRLSELGYSILSGASTGGGVMEAVGVGTRDGNGRSAALTVRGPHAPSVDSWIDVHAEFDYFATRGAMFTRYEDAAVLMPGGLYTVARLLESLSLIKKGEMVAYPLVLFGTAYWKGLIGWLRSSLLAQHEIEEPDLACVTITDDVEDAIAAITAARPI